MQEKQSVFPQPNIQSVQFHYSLHFACKWNIGNNFACTAKVCHKLQCHILAWGIIAFYQKQQ